ncbi:MAG TPA: transporter substrate-binding domain-containing protein, partial [Spirochaetota bacterium]
MQKCKGLIRVGTLCNNPPYQYLENGVPSGFDVDLIRAVARSIGYDVEFKSGDDDVLEAGLSSGMIDLLPGVARTPETEINFELSIPTYIVSFSTFVKGKPILSIRDLANKKVAMLDGLSVTKRFARNNPAVLVEYYTDEQIMLSLLEDGDVDAAILPVVQGLRLSRQMHLSDINSLGDTIFSEENCFAATKSHAALIMSLNEGLSIVRSSGLYQQIYSRWFGMYEQSVEQRIFRWVLILSGVLGALFVISVAFVYILRRLVLRRTAELAESERRYRIIVDNIPQSIFTKDAALRYVSCNINFAADCDRTCDEVIGNNDYDLYPKEYAEKYQSDDRRLMHSGNTEEIIERYIRNGRVRWVSAIKTPVKDKKGEITGILGIIWDVTERKTKDDELRESERRLKKAESVANIGSWEMDFAGEKFVWSEQLYRIFGFEPHEIIPTLDLALSVVHPDDREPLQTEIDRSIREGTGFSLHIRVMRRDGTVVWADSKGEVVCDKYG